MLESFLDKNSDWHSELIDVDVSRGNIWMSMAAGLISKSTSVLRTILRASMEVGGGPLSIQHSQLPLRVRGPRTTPYASHVIVSLSSLLLNSFSEKIYRAHRQRLGNWKHKVRSS